MPAYEATYKGNHKISDTDQTKLFIEWVSPVNFLYKLFEKRFKRPLNIRGEGDSIPNLTCCPILDVFLKKICA